MSSSMYTFEVNNASKYTVSAVEEIIFKLTEKLCWKM